MEIVAPSIRCGFSIHGWIGSTRGDHKSAKVGEHSAGISRDAPKADVESGAELFPDIIKEIVGICLQACNIMLEIRIRILLGSYALAYQWTFRARLANLHRP